MNTARILGGPDRPALEQLWRDIVREEQPGDGDAGERAVQESRRSLAEFDFLDGGSSWMIAAETDGRLVGYASAARIPKADARVGFLFIDELYVLSQHRKQGHATRILEDALAHAKDLRLGGIRLLVEPTNAAARCLYKRVGFMERDQILCERRI